MKINLGLVLEVQQWDVIGFVYSKKNTQLKKAYLNGRIFPKKCLIELISVLPLGLEPQYICYKISLKGS